jgi:hypothetical protein
MAGLYARVPKRNGFAALAPFLLGHRKIRPHGGDDVRVAAYELLKWLVERLEVRPYVLFSN